MANTKTIFLSHSSKDIEKVRKIRDILELLDYEPLMFHLRCLDDDNEKLEDFIKKEIDARNFFIYCKSQNSENSPWVQKELQYIKDLNFKRTYEINIERPFNETLIELLQSIASILRKNRIFISCSHQEPDRQLGEKIKKLLQKNDFDVFIHQYLDIQKDYIHKENLFSTIENGIFIPIISYKYIDSVYCRSELEMAKSISAKSNESAKIIPIFHNIGRNISTKMLNLSDNEINIGIDVDEATLTIDKENEILKTLLNN